MNIRAVAVLIAMPMAATTITPVVATGCGSISRRTASTEIAPSASSNSPVLASAARIELAFRP